MEEVSTVDSSGVNYLIVILQSFELLSNRVLSNFCKRVGLFTTRKGLLRFYRYVLADASLIMTSTSEHDSWFRTLTSIFEPCTSRIA